MTDITTRLRAAVNEIMHYQFTHGRPAMNALQVLIDDAEAAADEIERLQSSLDAERIACKQGWRYADELAQANTKLVGAIDMIRETLLGGNVEDLLVIINGALDEYRRGQKPSDAEAFGRDLWSGIV